MDTHSKPPKLMERVRTALRVKPYSPRDEKSTVKYISNEVRASVVKSPDKSGSYQSANTSVLSAGKMAQAIAATGVAIGHATAPTLQAVMTPCHPCGSPCAACGGISPDRLSDLNHSAYATKPMDATPDWSQ